MGVFEDRRKYPRVPREGPVFVKVVAGTDDEELSGVTLYCSTKDLSAGGIRVAASRLIPVDSILHLWIGMGDEPGTYMLSGRVAWLQDGGEHNDHMMGIEFLTDASEDINAWREMMKKKVF